MIAGDRLPCIGPGCRRTAPRSKYPDATGIVCGKCWKLLPLDLRQKHRMLERRRRWLVRRWQRKGVDNPPLPNIERLLGLNWDAIRSWLRAPQAPIGLAPILEELGLE